MGTKKSSFFAILFTYSILVDSRFFFHQPTIIGRLIHYFDETMIVE